MSQILAIAKLTVKEAVRFKLVALLAVFLIAAVTALPLLLKDDGTARGFAQILLTYSLGLTVTTLSFATLWLSCGLLARDIEDCRIQMIVVKPIARWKIWLGKWLGILILDAFLMIIAGGVIYGLLLYRASSLPEKQQSILQNEIFVARGVAKELPLNLEPTIEAVYQERLKQRAIESEVDKQELRRQIAEQVKYQYQLVPEGMMREWSIPLGMAADGLKDKPLYMRVEFIAMSHTSTFEDTRSFPMMWELGPANTPKSMRTVVMMVPNTPNELEIPPNLLDENGVLHIRFLNNQADTFFFDVNGGMEVLYRQGGFLVNYAKGLFVLFCWLALLGAIGLSASSFLSFPVASFFAIFILIMGLSTSTMTQVIDEGGIAGVNHETGRIDVQTPFDKATVYIFKVLRSAVNLVRDFSPVELLSQGRTITWMMIFSAIGQIVIVSGGLFACLGIYCFSRRELALAKGGQS